MLAIGSAVAGGVSSIFGGKAQGAAMRAQNEQAMRDWTRANSQISFNNAREHFQSAYAFTQQTKRNHAIQQAAFGYQADAMESLKNQAFFQQGQLSDQIHQNKASLLNAVTNKGISASSGMYGALAAMQAINNLKNAVQLEKNVVEQGKNITRQTEGMLSQMTENIFAPNIQMYNDAPIFGDPSTVETGGTLAGLLQIGGAVGGGYVSKRS